MIELKKIENPYGNPDTVEYPLWLAEMRCDDAQHQFDANAKIRQQLVGYMHANITPENIDAPRFDEFNAYLREIRKRSQDNRHYANYWRAVRDRIAAEQEAISKALKDEDIALTQSFKTDVISTAI